MKKNETCSSRMGRVGGQAVLEGVMMKSGDNCATACRKADGSIAVSRTVFVSARKKNKFCALPLVRGVVNFAEMMKLSMTTLNQSAEMMGETDEPETKFEKWLREKLHINLVAVVSAVGIVLGVALSVFLFIYLPRLISSLVLPAAAPGWRALMEGGVKVALFVGYIALVSLMRDMRRVFCYHGAEHKSVACYEAGDELTPENAKKYSRFHPRCGTSFMFVMILLGILFSVFINLLFPSLGTLRFGNLLYTLIKLLILPLVVGLGFEFILYAGRHNNLVVRILSAPGLWMQRLTTREPDETMLECAITALKCAMPEEYPDFDETTYDRSPKPAPAQDESPLTAQTAPDGSDGDTAEQTDGGPTATADVTEAPEASKEPELPEASETVAPPEATETAEAADANDDAETADAAETAKASIPFRDAEAAGTADPAELPPSAARPEHEAL